MIKGSALMRMREFMDAKRACDAPPPADALPVRVDGRRHEDNSIGWFGSSWDLRQGLLVIESADAQAELDAWMDKMMAQADGGWLLEPA